jgi:hypothetical protein
MSQTIQEKNKALVLEAFDTLSTSVTTQRLSAIGRPTTYSTAITSPPGVKVCLI